MILKLSEIIGVEPY